MGRIVQMAANKAASQWETLKATRNTLEASSITVDSGVAFDCGVIDDFRMTNALNDWSSITHMKDSGGNIMWKAADNTIHTYSQVEFQALVDEIRAKRAARSDALFAYAEQKRAQLPLPDSDPAFDPANWPA